MARKRLSSRSSQPSSSSTYGRIICVECNREFSYQSSLSRHQLTHQQIGKAPKVRIAKSYRPRSKKSRPTSTPDNNNNVVEDSQVSQECECEKCGQNFQKEEELWEHLFGPTRSSCGQESAAVNNEVKVETIEAETINNVAIAIKPMDSQITEMFHGDPSASPDPEISFRHFSSTPKSYNATTEKQPIPNSNNETTPKTRSRTTSSSSSRAKRFACGSCGLVESTSKKILYHAIQHHMPSPPYACPWCESHFETKKTLILHCRQNCSDHVFKETTVVSKARRKLSTSSESPNLMISEVKACSETITKAGAACMESDIKSIGGENDEVKCEFRNPAITDPPTKVEDSDNPPVLTPESRKKNEAQEKEKRKGRRKSTDKKKIEKRASIASNQPKIDLNSPLDLQPPVFDISKPVCKLCNPQLKFSTMNISLLHYLKDHLRRLSAYACCHCLEILPHKKALHAHIREQHLPPSLRGKLNKTLDTEVELDVADGKKDVEQNSPDELGDDFENKMKSNDDSRVSDGSVVEEIHDNSQSNGEKYIGESKETSEADEKDDSPAEIANNSPQQERSNDSPQRETKNISSQRRNTADFPQDESKENSTQCQSKKDSPRPVIKEDSPQPESEENSTQHESKEAFPTTESKADFTELEFNGDSAQRETRDDSAKRESKDDSTQDVDSAFVESELCKNGETKSSVIPLVSADSAIDLLDQDDDSEDLPELIVETESKSVELALCDSAMDVTCDDILDAKHDVSKDGNTSDDVLDKDGRGKRSDVSAPISRTTRSTSRAEESQDHRQHRSGLRSPTRETRISCPICKKLFRKPEHLSMHLGTHATSPTATLDPQATTIVCCLCNEKIHSSYKRHLIRHANEECTEFCLECGRAFTNQKALAQHSRITHRSAEEKCQLCNEVFSTWEDLASHRKAYHVECGYGKNTTPSKFDWLPSPIRTKEDRKTDSPPATDDSGSDDIAYLTLDSESPKAFSENVYGRGISTELVKRFSFMADSRPAASPQEPVNMSASSSSIGEPPELDQILDNKDVSAESIEPPELKKISPNRRRSTDPPQLRKVSPDRRRSLYKRMAIEPPHLRPKKFRFDHEDYNRSSETFIHSPSKEKKLLSDSPKQIEDIQRSVDQSLSEECTRDGVDKASNTSDTPIVNLNQHPEEAALTNTIAEPSPPVQVERESVNDDEELQSISCLDIVRDESVVNEVVNEIVSIVTSNAGENKVFPNGNVKSTNAAEANSENDESSAGRKQCTAVVETEHQANDVQTTQLDERCLSKERSDANYTTVDTLADNHQELVVSQLESIEANEETKVDKTKDPVSLPFICDDQNKVNQSYLNCEDSQMDPNKEQNFKEANTYLINCHTECKETDTNNNIVGADIEVSREEANMFVEIYRDQEPRRQSRASSDCCPVRQCKMPRSRPKSTSPNSSSKSKTQMISKTVKALKRFLTEHKEQLEREARHKSPVHPKTSSVPAPKLPPNRLTSDGVMWETPSSDKNDPEATEVVLTGETNRLEETAEKVNDDFPSRTEEIDREEETNTDTEITLRPANFEAENQNTANFTSIRSDGRSLPTASTIGLRSSSSDDIVLLRTPTSKTSPGKQSREGSDESVIIVGESQGDPMDEDYEPSIIPDICSKPLHIVAKSDVATLRRVGDIDSPKVLTAKMVSRLPSIELESKLPLSELGSEDSERTIITTVDDAKLAAVPTVPEATIDVQRWLNQIQPITVESLITDDVVPDDETLNDAINNVIDFSSTQLPELGDGGVGNDDERSDLSLLETKSSACSVKSEPVNRSGRTVISAQPLRRTSTRKHKCTVYCTKDSHPAPLSVPRQTPPHVQRFRPVSHQVGNVSGRTVTVTVPQLAGALTPIRAPRPVQRVATPHPQPFLRRNLHTRIRPSNASGNYLLHRKSTNQRSLQMPTPHSTQGSSSKAPVFIRPNPQPRSLPSILPAPQPQIIPAILPAPQLQTIPSILPHPQNVPSIFTPIHLYNNIQFFRLSPDTVDHVRNCYDPTRRSLVTVIHVKESGPVQGSVSDTGLMPHTTNLANANDVQFQHLVDPAELKDVVESEPEVISYASTIYDHTMNEIGTLQTVCLSGCAETVSSYHCVSCAGVFNDITALQRHSKAHAKVHIL